MNGSIVQFGGERRSHVTIKNKESQMAMFSLPHELQPDALGPGAAGASSEPVVPQVSLWYPKFTDRIYAREQLA